MLLNQGLLIGNSNNRSSSAIQSTQPPRGAAIPTAGMHRRLQLPAKADTRAGEAPSLPAADSPTGQRDDSSPAVARHPQPRSQRRQISPAAARASLPLSDPLQQQPISHGREADSCSSDCLPQPGAVVTLHDCDNSILLSSLHWHAGRIPSAASCLAPWK